MILSNVGSIVRVSRSGTSLNKLEMISPFLAESVGSSWDLFWIFFFNKKFFWSFGGLIGFSFWFVGLEFVLCGSTGGAAGLEFCCCFEDYCLNYENL